MEEKKKRRGGRRKAKKEEEMMKVEGEKAEKEVGQEVVGEKRETASTEVKEGFRETTVRTQAGVKGLEQKILSIVSISSLISQRVKEIREKIGIPINMVKNLYSLFQAMKQSYGGDTKKVILAVLSFIREEGKRRANEFKSRVKKKIFGELD